MNFPTWVEVDLDRLDHNLHEIRREIGPDVAILFVVKADAYGHGSVEVGRAALASGVVLLGVATLHEGIELRQAGINEPILILSPNLPGELDEILAYRLRPTLSTPEQATDLSAWVAGRGDRIPVHLEVDTGMGRTGFDYETAEADLLRISQLPGIEMEGAFTHFPDSDGPETAFTLEQMSKFDRLLDRLAAAGLSFRYRHAANSAALMSLPGSRLNMVRPGIAVLGIYPSSHVPRRAALKPVLSFHCRLVQVRPVPAGRHISYGGTFVTERDSRIGVIAVGYGHGLSRLLSNRGQVMIRGRRVPIIGRVTMDLTMVDLTDLPLAAVGDDVLLFGDPPDAAPGGDSPIRIEEVAAWAETIPWEIMCQIDKRVVRKYVRSGQVVKVMTLVGERLALDEGVQSGVIYAGGRRSIRATSNGY